ncbi:MAG: hypothetical protein Q4E88_02360 [Coriobacteriia bacterium]|nr:hypothetical protein [Coriobacteriia bacterium]
MSEIAKKSKRILSVDVLRGITIVFMILIDDPAGKKFEFMCHQCELGSHSSFLHRLSTSRVT